MLRYLLTFLLSFAFLVEAKSQLSICGLSGTIEEDCLNDISTAVPLLSVNVNAANGGIGDTGIAVSPKTNTIFFNSAKMVFNKNEGGISLSFVPWLRFLGLDDVYLTSLTSFEKINEFQAIGCSLRYFKLGGLDFSNMGYYDRYKPREIVADIAYAHKLNKQFSIGTNLKYIYSNLNEGDVTSIGKVFPGQAVAVDFSAFYIKNIQSGNTKGNFNAGLSVSNLGNKISYLKSKEWKYFLPANLGVGVALELQLSNNRLTFAYDLNKLLVPTPTINRSLLDKTALQGIFISFTDTSFEEELRELTHSFGIEFWFSDFLALRSGFFKEHKTKGNLGYLTFGLGGQYKSVAADVSYILDNHRPLNRTFKFSVACYL